MVCAALLAPVITPTDPPPRFRAVAELWHTGIRVIDANGSISHAGFRRFGRDAELKPGPDGSYAIMDGHRVATYDGLHLKSIVRFDDRPWVIGWDRGWPILRSGDHAYQVSGRYKRRLDGLREHTESVAGKGGGRLLFETDFIANGTLYAGYSRYYYGRLGVTHKITTFGSSSGTLAKYGPNVLVAIDADYPDNSNQPGKGGGLFLFDLDSGEAKPLASDSGQSWMVRPADIDGNCWITESGYLGRQKKFFDFGTAWSYGRDGLHRVQRANGDLTFNGLDKTRRWLLTTRWYGWEMGAYDLVARNVKTGEERFLYRAVEEFERID